ncbi:MAG: hypothetical protein B5M51_03635 [Anaerolinea sp. 4484_236]|nr:MAG: hypothetical protein B5M51_03635 [Anaerolinea sp. 4484_236]
MTPKSHQTIWQRAIKETFTLNSTMAAAGIAYFALLSLFPLILLMIAIASIWFDPMWVESELITQLEFVIPGISGLLGSNLEKLVEARSSVSTTASLVLIWSGSTLFSIIARVLDTMWNGKDVRTGWRYRGLALLAVCGISAIVLPMLFIGTTLTPMIDRFVPDVVVTLYENLVLLVTILISCLLFGLLYRYLPHAGPSWREVWPGAITCGVLWEIAKRGFLYYSSNFLSASNLVYGSVATIIAFLTWVYISGLIFFFGAHLIIGYSRRSENLEHS